jgi:hypothetical protein
MIRRSRRAARAVTKRESVSTEVLKATNWDTAKGRVHKAKEGTQK